MFIVPASIPTTGGYVPAGAIWFDGVSDYLTWTPSSTTNPKKWTTSFWIKWTVDGAATPIFYTDSYFQVPEIQSNGSINLEMYESATTKARLVSSGLRRDPTAWFHVVCVQDTDNATSSDRQKMFINGVRVTAFSTETYSALGYTPVGGPTCNVGHYIGARYGSADYGAFYLAEAILLDGTASSDASEFGEFDSNGNWVPIDPSGLTFGTNGFWLDFADSADLGKDVSGNGNDFSPIGGSSATVLDFTEASDTQGSLSTTGRLGGTFTLSSATNVSRIQVAAGRLTGATGNCYCEIYNVTGTVGTDAAGTGTINDDALGISAAQDVSTWSVASGHSGYTWTWFNFTQPLFLPAGDYCFVFNSEATTDLYFYLETRASQNTNVTSASAGTWAAGSNVYFMNFVLDGHAAIPSSQVVNDNPADDAANDLGNYVTWNPIDPRYGYSLPSTFANGNLDLSSSGGARAYSTIEVTEGHFYAEITLGSNSDTIRFGVQTQDGSYLFFQWKPVGSQYYITYEGGLKENVGTSVTTGDVIGCEVDVDGNSVQFTKNGVAWGSAYGLTNAPGPDNRLFFVGQPNSSDFDTDFGQYGFAYTIPTGATPLTTANLPAPTVTDPSAYFSVGTHTGSGSSDSYDSGLDSIGLLIAKRYDGAAGWEWFDAVRGANSLIQSNNTDAAVTKTGFSFSGGTFNFDNTANLGQSGTNHVVYTLKANGAGSSNTDGSITSTVSVADHGGFSIVKYTGAGSAGTVGHGMSRTPEMIINKPLASSTDNNWATWHKDLTSAAYAVYLNLTNTETNYPTFMNSTAPTSSVFSIGTDRDSAVDYINYCFSRTPGLIGIGSYTDNGSTDGPYVVVDDGASGFRPKWLMVKRTDGAYDWQIVDAIRDTYNPVNKNLSANLSVAEGSGLNVDFTANGCKWRVASNSVNASGGTYIYLAFAEYPFGGEGVAQAKAR